MLFGNRRFGDSSFVARLMISSAVSALAIGSAQAQTPAPSVETVTVTGTSIRGAQPTGSNLITLDRTTIESTGAQTVQQLLTTIPSVSGFGSSPQGNQGVPAAIGIHGVGQGSSTATLVLIDGHRFPGEGGSESDPDPSLIPGIALQRVEVLPDGASAIYGSDAVSGVINFVTRKDFTGVETSVQAGIADHYNTFDGSLLLGHAWDGGSFLAAYQYSSQSNLMNSSRSFITARQDIRRGAADPTLFTGVAATPPAGSMTTTPAAGPGTSGPYGVTIPYPSSGFNFQNFSCPVATIAPSSSTNAFYYQPTGGYGGASFSTSTTNVPSQGACDNLASSSSLPSVIENNGMIQFRQDLTNNLHFDMEAVYGDHLAASRDSRGTITAQVFGPTAGVGAGSNATTIAAAAAGEINPFYVGNATTGTATEFVRYDLNALLGPGAYTKTNSQALFLTSGLNWDLGNDQEIVISTVYGNNLQAAHTSGAVSAGAALLALNGTTNTNGTPGLTSQPDVFGLGTSVPASRVLTTLNALDVWDPAGPTNKTSAQVLSSLADGGNVTNANQGIYDISAKFDGPVYDLPAGPVKIAVGGEFEHAYFDEYGTRAQAAGPALSNSSGYYYRNGRNIYSAFVEVSAPLVNPEMNVPLMRSLTLDMSGRWDKYSKIGDTENPKIGFDWGIVDGIKGRGSYGTSFVAPNLHDANQPNNQSTIGTATNFSNPTIPFGDTRPFNGGAGLGGTWVSTAAACAAGGGTVVNSAGATVAAPFTGAFGCKTNFAATNAAGQQAGLNIPGGNSSLKPATGRTYSGGFDIDAGKLVNILDGLTVSLTYYDFEYHNLITNQQTQNNLPQLTFFAPIGGWTPTSPFIQQFILGKPLNNALPSSIWVTTDSRLQNAFNIWENGLDFSVNYGFRTENAGNFTFGLDGNEILRYSTQGGNTGPILDTKDGKNSPRYPSAELQFRTKLGWAFDALSTQLSMNYVHPLAYTTTNFPYNLSGPGRGFALGPDNAAVFTSAGAARLGALITFDFNASYAVPTGFGGLPQMATDGVSLSLTVQNLLNSTPPFSAASSSGTGSNGNPANGNVVLREFVIGLRKKF